MQYFLPQKQKSLVFKTNFATWKALWIILRQSSSPPNYAAEGTGKSGKAGGIRTGGRAGKGRKRGRKRKRSHWGMRRERRGGAKEGFQNYANHLNLEKKSMKAVDVASFQLFGQSRWWLANFKRRAGLRGNAKFGPCQEGEAGLLNYALKINLYSGLAPLQPLQIQPIGAQRPFPLPVLKNFAAHIWDPDSDLRIARFPTDGEGYFSYIWHSRIDFSLSQRKNKLSKHFWTFLNAFEVFHGIASIFKNKKWKTTSFFSILGICESKA